MFTLLWLWCMGPAWAGLPLESVDFTVDVQGPLAEITIEQVFVNDTDRELEATYIFPLHEEAAVDAMRMEFDGRVIVSQILERQAAKERYREARENGVLAAITEQDRPNLFTQSVTNIPPGEHVRVVLHVV